MASRRRRGNAGSAARTPSTYSSGSQLARQAPSPLAVGQPGAQPPAVYSRCAVIARASVTKPTVAPGVCCSAYGPVRLSVDQPTAAAFQAGRKPHGHSGWES
eukprot:scaffold10327_cov122-Isochrysis_galbana.AAC.3